MKHSRTTYQRTALPDSQREADACKFAIATLQAGKNSGLDRETLLRAAELMMLSLAPREKH